MQVTNAWLIYILVVLALFILLSWCSTQFHFDTTVRLFIASLVGAIVTLIVIPSVIAQTSDERTWYSLLLIVAFLGPIILAVWLAWSRNWLWNTGGSNVGNQREFSCDENGCRLLRETQSDGYGRDTYHYE